MQIGRTSVANKDLVFALLFVVIGGFGIAYGWATLKIESPTGLGPGFFPVVLSAIIVVLALLVGVGGIGRTSESEVFAPLRSIILVIAAPVVFGLLIRTAGLAVAVGASVLVASFASSKIKLMEAVMLAAGVTFFCVLLFYYLLRLPLPLFGSVFQ